METVTLLPARPYTRADLDSMPDDTRLIDLNLKHARLEAAGCPSYWVVDPQTPSITVWESQGERLHRAAYAEGDSPCHIHLPFEVTIVPADLIGTRTTEGP